jgi:hypothetical protein
MIRIRKFCDDYCYLGVVGATGIHQYLHLEDFIHWPPLGKKACVWKLIPFVFLFLSFFFGS